MAQHFDAVNVRHIDVGNDEVVKSAVDLALCPLAGIHGLHLVAVAPQGYIEHFAHGALVVTDQNVSHAQSLPRRRPRLWRPARPPQATCVRHFSIPAGAGPTPSAATAAPAWCPRPVSSAPTPCLHAPERSDTRSPNRAPCRRQNRTGKAQKFSPTAAGSFRLPCRQS